MDAATLEGRLEFIRQAERLRTCCAAAAAPAAGRSTAEHSWRLCLMAMLFQDGLVGWIRCACCSCAWSTTWARRWAAMCRRSRATRIRTRARERRDLLQLARSLDPAARKRLLALWDSTRPPPHRKPAR